MISFLTWCADQTIDTVLPQRIAPLRRQFPKTYGKVQAPMPARWLTRDEAFNQLVTSCRFDETIIGLRDELALRLGLGGVRVSEIAHLAVGDLRLNDPEPTAQWMGKGNKPRRIVLGPSLVEALRRYLDAYAEGLGTAVPRTAPLLCKQAGNRTPRLSWGTTWTDGRVALHRIVTTRAAQAGLGYVAPHDLRRSAAGILHHALSPDGGHLFDLLDIQKVLDHADPATTMRSYLDPMDTGVKGRAATLLD